MNMINTYKTVDWAPSPNRIRRTLAVIMLFLLVLLLLLWLKTADAAPILKCGSAVFILLLAGILFPAVGKWIYRIWFGAACTAGFCISNLILLICFYIIITPLALIRRLFGVQPLPLKHQQHSNWTDHQEQIDPAGYFRQF